MSAEFAYLIWTTRRERERHASWVPAGRIRGRSTNPGLADCHQPEQTSVQVGELQACGHETAEISQCQLQTNTPLTH